VSYPLSESLPQASSGKRPRGGIGRGLGRTAEIQPAIISGEVHERKESPLRDMRRPPAVGTATNEDVE